MNTAWKIGKGLLILTQAILETALEISNQPKQPVCGVMEAYGRKERGTITEDDV